MFTWQFGRVWKLSDKHPKAPQVSGIVSEAARSRPRIASDRLRIAGEGKARVQTRESKRWTVDEENSRAGGSADARGSL